ncbi:MAG: glycine--tRNA ligase subunit beta [Gammaproteobacteria bacterium]|nr:glycine--tRNA ligase subunit beta [Gammaproteobacteria bacterium]
MDASDLLIEIGTEELPPRALSGLAAAFAASVCQQLDALALSYTSCKHFATPRRLALLLRQLQHAQSDQEKTRFGPAVKMAFKANGEPTPAAEGFARSCGIEIEELQRMDKGGVEKLCLTTVEKGAATGGLVPDIVNQALADLPVPKRMRWGCGRTEFVRPVHWVVLLFGSKHLSGQILGIDSSRDSFGHRFHHSGSISLTCASDYEAVLEDQGKVIACFDRRMQLIRDQVLAAGQSAGGTAVIDESLLEEVTALVEYPVALIGNFNPAFLEVPQEALVLTMQSHQKCFTLVDKDHKLLPKFITISNLQSRDPARVIEGNERVIRPRLADARFFFDTDRQQTLADRYPQLDNLIFQDRLGTVGDKCERISKLAVYLAGKSGANPDHCARAARLCKCDLLTSMVGEFADLQGVMGYYYANHDGESEEIAQAIREHYQPRFAADAVPDNLVGSLLAIADKLDSIIGLFGIGKPPTGSKDPFALRRAAIGVLRIMIENALALDLKDCIETAVKNYGSTELEPNTAEAVFEFMLDRLRSWYVENGVEPEVFESVYQLRPPEPLDFHARVQAVNSFITVPEADALVAAYKRVSRLLTKENKDSNACAVNESLLQANAESVLYGQLQHKEAEVQPLFEIGNYNSGLQALAELKTPVDSFFDQVMVMADDKALRDNRLALLQRLKTLFDHTADISQLHQN